MTTLTCKTISEAWPKLLHRVLSMGTVVGTKNGEYNTTMSMEYKDIIQTTIYKPLEDMIPQRSIYKEHFLKFYAGEMLGVTKNIGFDYEYGSRLRNYQSKVDQLDHIITTLKYDDLNSRRAIATIGDPVEDCGKINIPCLQLLDFKYRDDRLHLVCYFRSHDIYAAWSANAYALAKLLGHVASKINVEVGTLTIISNKAHVYGNDVEAAWKVVGRVA